ncbi:MAG: phospholipase D family protein [Pseudomonadota bacterium]|nr:phospholipase D family protein [Pseudomonadota bacterium]
MKTATFTRLAQAALTGVVMMSVLSGCGGLPNNDDRTRSQVIDDGPDTQLGKRFGEETGAHPDKNGVLLLPEGRDAFVARALLARLAERSIDTQYYMWHQDTVGRLLIKELIDAADRGVRVRLLVDDMYGSDGQDTWLAMDAHPRIEVRLFNPFSRSQPKFLQFVTRFKDVNYRMHSKTFTVDDSATVVGGRNIGDEYFEADPDLSFADMDALAVGPAVPEVSTEFDEYWNSEYAYPVSTISPAGTDADLQRLRGEAEAFFAESSTSSYLQAVDDSRLANDLRAGTVAFHWAPGKIIHDSSEKKAHDDTWQQELLISQLAPYITGSTEEVIMVSPYFVPGQPATDALCKLAKNGVRVRVLTNSLASNDVAAVHAGYTKYRKPLLRCGVELYELNEALTTQERRAFSWLPGLSKSSLHAKTMAFDKQRMFVGSFNFDQRSLHINNEIGLLFEQPDLAGSSAGKFDRNIDKVAFKVELQTDDNGNETLRWRGIENGNEVEFDSEPYVGFGTRAAVWFIRLLPVESLL